MWGTRVKVLRASDQLISPLPDENPRIDRRNMWVAKWRVDEYQHVFLYQTMEKKKDF